MKGRITKRRRRRRRRHPHTNTCTWQLHMWLSMTAMEERGNAKERVEWNGGEKKKGKLVSFHPNRHPHVSSISARRRKDAPSLRNVWNKLVKSHDGDADRCHISNRPQSATVMWPGVTNWYHVIRDKPCDYSQYACSSVLTHILQSQTPRQDGNVKQEIQKILLIRYLKWYFILQLMICVPPLPPCAMQILQASSFVMSQF